SIKKELTPNPTAKALRAISVLKSKEKALSAFALAAHIRRKQRTAVILFPKTTIRMSGGIPISFLPLLHNETYSPPDYTLI
ncbi:MAG: hypothetical protein FWC65_02210, partial [Treponema sp.]|nr:hypothetical protein [Treponema sp.]